MFVSAQFVRQAEKSEFQKWHFTVKKMRIAFASAAPLVISRFHAKYL
jgi:hypothetical protein